MLMVTTLPLAGAAAACTGSAEPEAPDPLVALAAQARADVAAANGVAAAHPDLGDAARLVASVREQHATALQREVDRLHPPGTSTAPAPPAAATSAPPAAAQVGTATARAALATAMTTAEQQATNLVPTLPRYRAGLVGSVAAGCASLREVLS
jgi:hypothetical protein